MAEHRAAGAHGSAARRGRAHAGAVGLEPRDWRALVDARARASSRGGQAPGQPGRVDQAAPLGQVRGAVVGGRAHLRPGLLGAQRLGRPAVGARRLDDLGDVLGLVGRRGEGELARLLESGIDALALDRLPDGREVLAAEPLELGHLVRPARHAVLDPMRERGVHEAAVAPARAERDALALEQHDVPVARASSAAQRPVRPPPITSRSACSSASSGGPGSGAPGWVSQKGRGSASASASIIERRGRDLNPRAPCGTGCFQGSCNRPDSATPPLRPPWKRNFGRARQSSRSGQVRQYA